MNLNDLLFCIPGPDLVMVTDIGDEPLYYGAARKCPRNAAFSESEVLRVEMEFDPDGNAYIAVELDYCEVDTEAIRSEQLAEEIMACGGFNAWCCEW